MRLYDETGNEYLCFSATRVIRLDAQESRMWEELERLHDRRSVRKTIEAFTTLALGMAVILFTHLPRHSVVTSLVLLLCIGIGELARTWKRDQRWWREIQDKRKTIVLRHCNTLPPSYIVRMVDEKE